MKKIRILSLLLCAALALTLTSCGYQMSESLDRTKLIPSGQAENDPKATGFEKMAENERLEFWMNPDTTHWKVVDRSNGYEWTSYQKTASQDASDQALLGLTYVDRVSTPATMNSTENCVNDGQYEITPAENGAQVVYSFGKYGSAVKVPDVLTEERYQQLYDNIEDEFDLGNLETGYVYVDINTVTDDTMKEQYLTKYPKLSEQPLYIISGLSATEKNKQHLAEIFAAAGYTDQDFEEDKAYFSTESTTDESIVFMIRVCYELDGDSLKVTVPADGISMLSECPLLSINLFPYFASATMGDKGWYLLPDGCGALMNFYNGKGFYQPLTLSVYGGNDSLNRKEIIFRQPNAYLPFYGVKNGDNALLAQIEQGAAITEINTFTGSDTRYAFTYPTFSLRDSFRSTYTIGTADSYTIIQKDRCMEDLAMRYTFLSGGDADYNKMGALLRERIFGTENRIKDGGAPVLLRTVGSAEKKKNLFGFGYTSKQVLTTFDQVGKIADEFLDRGIENLSVQCTGWFDGGYKHTNAAKASPLSCLGGKKGMEQLAKHLKEKNVAFYPDADVQYIYQKKTGDGFRKNRDTAALITRQQGTLSKYSLSSFQKQSTVQEAWILNLSGITRAMDGLESICEKIGADGISYRNLGNRLNADYTEGETEDRVYTAAQIAKQLSETAKSGKKLLTSGAIAEYLPFLTGCCELPASSSGYNMTDMDVPILQMVLSGNVNCYGSSVNLSGDLDTCLLEAAQTGSGTMLTLIGNDTQALKDTGLENFFASDYNYYGADYVDAILAYNKAIAPVAGKRLVRFTQLTEGVTVSEFENGAKVTVNRTAADYGGVAAKSFRVTEVGS